MYAIQNYKLTSSISMLIALFNTKFLCVSSFETLLELKNEVNPLRYDEGDFGCVLSKETERLQMAIVADTTGTNYRNIRDAFVKACRDIINGINAIHKDTEFSITTHSNWEDSAWHARHNLPEGCYTRQVNFTTNVEELMRVASGIKELKGPRGPKEENSIPAVCFTVADAQIGWERKEIDDSGKHIHRLVALFTDVYTRFELPYPRNRTEFRGDGTDTCLNNRPPTRDVAGKFLKEHNIIMIGVYVGMDKGDVRRYVEFFNEFDIPHIPTLFSNTRDLERNIARVLAQTVKEHLQCYFEDPPAYNTLGL